MANNPANNTVKDLKAQGYKVVKARNGVYHVSKGNKRWEIDLTKEEQKGGVIRFLKSGGGIATVAGVAAVLALGAKVAVDYFNDPSGFASKYLAKGSELWNKAKLAVEVTKDSAKNVASSSAEFVKEKASEATKAVTDAAKSALESGKEAYTHLSGVQNKPSEIDKFIYDTEQDLKKDETPLAKFGSQFPKNININK